MCRKLSILLFFLFLVIGPSAGVVLGAVPIEVENFSFEDPNEVKVIGWDLEDGAHYETGGPAEVPGWESDGSIDDSGVETGWDPTHGLWTGFLMSQDPSAYNLTNFLIGSGDVYKLEIDAENNWEATDFELSLYYDDNGSRIIVAANTVSVGDSKQTYSVTFAADTVPASYDHEIGIDVNNVSADLSSWVGLDNVRLTLTSPLYRAYTPYPEHKSSYEGTSVELMWLPGPNLPSADNYHVYISSDRNEVDSNHPNADMGLVGDPNYLYADLVQGPTYYWRIDTVSGATTYRGSTWRFSTKPLIAYNPDPDTGAEYVPVDPLLGWDAGTGAVEGHVVIVGDSLSEVSNAPTGTSGTEPPYRSYLTDVNDTNCTPLETGHPALEVSTTYYWRVDTVEVDPGTIHKGDVWEFTTVPVVGLGSITREVWMGISGNTIASLTDNANYPDNPTTTNYPTSLDAPRRWEVDYGTRIHGWLYIETTGDYTFWLAADDVGELWLDNEVIATASASGYHQWSTAPEQQSEPIHLEADNLYYIMALQKQGNDDEDHLGVAWSDSNDVDTAQIIPGTSLIPFEQYVPVQAYKANPVNKRSDVPRDVILSWAPGEYAVAHRIYFGADEQAVLNADTSSPEYRGTRDIGTESYQPELLEWYTTYYWRIDEVNDAHPDSPWIGNVWSFTTANFIVVDDFEDYNDTPPYTVWNAWADGFGDPNNGSQVGHDDAPYAEQAIVHGGSQSMPVDYNNITTGLSEVTRTLDSGRDWTYEGVKALSLWFRGYPAYVGSFIEDPVGTYTITAAGADIWGQADEFHFAYRMLTGVGSIEAQILSVDNTDASALAGVMIRNTLEPGSRFAAVFITPEDGCIARARLEADIDALSDADMATEEQAAINAPYWVRLERSLSGDITFYYSNDGSSWQLMAWGPQLVPMNTVVHVGLALSAHNADATCEAQFSNVTIEGNLSGDWEHQDIGIQSNDPEPMYVAVANNTGTPAVVYHEDPNVTQVNDWTEWNIDLKDFEDQGVVLTDVNSVTLGFGNKTDLQASGNMGTMYFDDIRLYLPRCVPDELTLAKADLNSDCVVDLRDLEVMAGDWLLTDDIVATTAPSADGLVAHWMLDGNANDSSGNGNDGVLNGSPQWISAGHIGGALQLDGTGDYVDCANDVSFDITDAITLAAWVNTNDTGNGQHNPYVSKGDTAYAIKHYTDNSIEFFIYDGDWYQARSDALDGSFNGIWHHVAGTYDGDQIKLYIDGGLRATTDHAGSIATNTFPVYIGSNSEAEDRFYDGLIDDVRIYNRVLTKQEIGYLGDLTPGDGQVYVPLLSSAELYGVEPEGSKAVNFKDFAILADQWLDEQVWPQP